MFLTVCNIPSLVMWRKTVFRCTLVGCCCEVLHNEKSDSEEGNIGFLYNVVCCLILPI